MNAVEIEQALSELAQQPFVATEFPYLFLAAFGIKATTIARLRKGDRNASDVSGAVLLRNHIHIAVAEPGQVGRTLTVLMASPKTVQAKAKFVLATDGATVEAEELGTGDAIACEFAQIPDHFGFFLPLAGITTIREIKDNPIDVRATGRLNKLYVELLRENPEWATEKHRPDMNHFMARLIFCFFAEDTDIFPGAMLFTATVDQMSARDGSNVHEVLEIIFRSMNTRRENRAGAGIPRWTTEFPYVNGGLFSGTTDAPRFTRTARAYLYQAGQLDWRAINPDIFGSMIQAVADDEERGALGMHYTSVPNILKVLNPLFLDDLRSQLEAADHNKIKLLNLRKRIARIRVFDPACGSGNFLVIAYKQMREIEAEINRRRDEANLPSEIPVNNFRGIELRDFPAEIARLALIIAEFQCDVLYRGQKEALKDVLPLDSQNWITCGNALRLDWRAICPPNGTGVKLVSDDLFNTPLDQSEIDFENEGGETYLCGNPPYLGTKYQSAEQKADLKRVFQVDGLRVGNLDYVGGWLRLAAQYVSTNPTASFAFVTTTSLFQGEQADIVHRVIKNWGLEIAWCHSEFKWANQATNNAGVSCCIVGFAPCGKTGQKRIYDETSVRAVANIGPYLIAMPDVVVAKRSAPLSEVPPMTYGSMSNDGGAFTLDMEAYRDILRREASVARLVVRAVGGNEFVNGLVRFAIYVDRDESLTRDQLRILDPIFQRVASYRGASARAATRKLSEAPMSFAERRHERVPKVFVPQIFSERREYVTAGLLPPSDLVIAPHMQIVGADLCAFSLISSRMHMAWVATVCGKLESRIRYSNTLGWNAFPVPVLTEQNRADLSASALEILLTRESHFPATIAELYDPSRMPDDLRRAHDKNDEVVERIYIGRKFKNDTERLEKLFELYTRMAVGQSKPNKGKRK